jgi:DNA modification methylase
MKVRKNKIYCGDCLQILKQFPDNFIDMCVTSPPYYGLRDYGTAKWEGGDDNCDHINPKKPSSTRYTSDEKRDDMAEKLFGVQFRNVCGKCGAIRVDNQIGLEETPEMYVQKLVEVFREVRRVLKKEGTLWLNLGDSYCGSGVHTGVADHKYGDGRNDSPVGLKNKINGYKSKDLIGIPWMVAFALRADGWYLRQDIIWNKPNPMPESVTDRCTKAHEYIFLLSKSAKYYYDADAVKEKNKRDWSNCGGNLVGKGLHKCNDGFKDNNNREPAKYNEFGANKRSVWTVTTKPFKKAHFATFPQALIKPCILAGCIENGLVLDPFIGAGTVGVVCKKLHRNYIGIELNEKYVKMAEKRISDQPNTLFGI